MSDPDSGELPEPGDQELFVVQALACWDASLQPKGCTTYEPFVVQALACLATSQQPKDCTTYLRFMGKRQARRIRVDPNEQKNGSSLSV
jgi:hypothetical protein